ncbi:MAG: hypothetical protein KME13_25645 [Myxacorys californica WJT36-NPBG1]|jgi:hypothetical protein|nr:hypothetical protein [Myxacorys californica WJT36-NPBG1]
MKTKAEKIGALAELHRFTGTLGYYRYSPQLFPNVVLTDGVRFLVETAQCYWLVDAIAAIQSDPTVCNHPQLAELQFWTLLVDENESATLLCEWESDEVVYTQKIEWADFPLPQQRIWVAIEENCIVIMLPSEY